MAPASGNHAAATAALIDITPLPKPPPSPWPLVVSGTGAVVLVLAVAWWLRRRRSLPRVQARRLLRRTHQRFSAGTPDPRRCAFDIAHALRLAIGRSRLTPETPPAAADDVERWRSFIVQLQRARFAPQPLTAEDMVALLAEARHWMGRRP
ncbi:MAG: hypothetical protein P8076_02970 [Gammaproteobacteria bacterium]